MSYMTHAEIVQSNSMRLRITACVAQEGVGDPPRWVSTYIWTLPKADWIAAWEYMEASTPGDDHGANEAGVTDAMILASVQAQLTPPEAP